MKVTNKDLIKYILEESKYKFKNEPDSLLESVAMYFVFLPIVLTIALSVIGISAAKLLAGGPLFVFILSSTVPVAFILAQGFIIYLKVETLREEAAGRIVKNKIKSN